MWDLSCPDWGARIMAGRSLMPDLPLYRDEADIAVQFFDGLCLPDVPDRPLLRDAAGDWFREIVAALFGARDPATNIRHIREAFILVGKGNSKTSYGAALMVVALLMNTRPRAEFLFVGPTQAISDIAFEQASGMVEADEALKKRFHVRDHKREIKDRLNGAKLRIKTFDLKILTGPKPVGVLVDEPHLLGKVPATAKVLRQIRGGLEKSTEGFLVFITTQSDEPPAGAFRNELMLARQVRDGKFKGRTLPILYEFPDEIARNQAKWEDPRYWPLVMPNLGRSLKLESLLQDLDAERRKGPHEVRVWASQHLNIEIGAGGGADIWAGATFWEAAADDDLTLESLLERCDVAVVGIDGGGLDDLLGLTVLGREKETRAWLSWSHAWAHECVLRLRQEIAPRLRDFEAEESLTIIPDDSDEDVKGVADIIEQVNAAGLLPETKAIGVDPVGISAIVDELELRGFSADPETGQIGAIRQGYVTLNNTVKTAERRLAARTLMHDGSALMSWCVGNAKIEKHGNAIVVTKAAAGIAKIDPLMALYNGVALMALNPSVGVPDVAAMIA